MNLRQFNQCQVGCSVLKLRPALDGRESLRSGPAGPPGPVTPVPHAAATECRTQCPSRPGRKPRTMGRNFNTEDSLAASPPHPGEPPADPTTAQDALGRASLSGTVRRVTIR